MTRESIFAEAPLVVGHRGGRGEGWPMENSIAAFERAREEGARAIELDARTCARGEIVVFHDAEIEGRPVADVSVEALARRGVPRLDEALAWAAARSVAVNVELKHDVVSRWSLARAASRIMRASGAEVLVSSFDPALLAMIAVLAPTLPRAILTHARQGRVGGAVLASARRLAVRAVHLERTQTSPALVAELRRRGLRVGAWTVNDPGEARDLVRLGVATIITDSPLRIGPLTGP